MEHSRSTCAWPRRMYAAVLRFVHALNHPGIFRIALGWSSLLSAVYFFCWALVSK